ncbi:MAG: FliH/SctL family protein [Desulfobacterota bacterium]|nr:FliH/SctL family protein [Thermodesulfobacteriota bacterium]
MFSSKIIKHKDKEKNGIRSFFLQKFHSDTENESNHKENQSKKEVVAAHELKARAQQEAQLMLESARREAMRIQHQAHEQGYREGLLEGRAHGEAEFSSIIASLHRIQEEFTQLKQRFFEEHQDIILELALKIARSVIHHEIQLQNDVVLNVLKDAIRLAMDRERLKIRVHPDDLAVCLEHRPDILKDIDGVKQIIFEPDETITKGGALIEYALGEIDARIEQQFSEIEANLRSAHHAH